MERTSLSGGAAGMEEEEGGGGGGGVVEGEAEEETQATEEALEEMSKEAAGEGWSNKRGRTERGRVSCVMLQRFAPR